LIVYECEFGGRSVNLIVAINGLDEIPASSHAIEDHLVKL